MSTINKQTGGHNVTHPADPIGWTQKQPVLPSGMSRQHDSKHMNVATCGPCTGTAGVGWLPFQINHSASRSLAIGPTSNSATLASFMTVTISMAVLTQWSSRYEYLVFGGRGAALSLEVTRVREIIPQPGELPACF